MADAANPNPAASKDTAPVTDKACWDTEKKLSATVKVAIMDAKITKEEKSQVWGTMTGGDMPDFLKKQIEACTPNQVKEKMFMLLSTPDLIPPGATPAQTAKEPDQKGK